MGLTKKLNMKKSANVYGISTKLIQIVAEIIINHLSLILNCSIEKIKVSLIYPILKAKSKFDCSNY